MRKWSPSGPKPGPRQWRERSRVRVARWRPRSTPILIALPAHRDRSRLTERHLRHRDRALEGMRLLVPLPSVLNLRHGREDFL